jgi:hypothetical protein
MIQTATRDDSNERGGFHAYARTIAQGGSMLASQARLVVAIGGATPGRCRERNERDLTLGRIDCASYRIRSEAIDELAQAYRAGVQTHAVSVSDSADWEPLWSQDGTRSGHMRKEHRHDQ